MKRRACPMQGAGGAKQRNAFRDKGRTAFAACARHAMRHAMLHARRQALQWAWRYAAQTASFLRLASLLPSFAIPFDVR